MNATMMLVCLAGSMTVGQPEPPIFKAPGIEVFERTDFSSRDKDTLKYRQILYNRINIGTNFLKPDDPKLQGDAERDLSLQPTTYFHRKSPIGIVMEKYKAGKPPIAVIGMDVGTMAAYARKDQPIHFFERVPTIVKLSQPDKDEKPLFTYIPDAKARGAKVKIFEGEPRETIEKQAGDGFYQVIIVNTYKLPVVTVHKELMTKEGMKMLMDKTKDDGILCYHVSNRYYDLVPIVASVAKELNYASLVGHDEAPWDEGAFRRGFSSEWVMVARKAEHLSHLKTPDGYDQALKGQRRPPEPYWSAAKRSDKKFIWTDNGENPFRGIYRSDPSVGEFARSLYDFENFLNANVGFLQVHRYSQSVHNVMQRWAASNAEFLNREPPKSPKDKKEPKSDTK